MVTRNGENWGYKNVRKEDWFYEGNIFSDLQKYCPTILLN